MTDPGYTPAVEHYATQVRPRLRLGITAGAGAGRSFSLGAVARLGRTRDNEIQVMDPEVSRLHAIIYEYEQGYAIVDQDSSNGTFVNGVRITGPTWIAPGDHIRIGRTEFRISGGEMDSRPRPEISQPVQQAPAQPTLGIPQSCIWLAAGGSVLVLLILTAAAFLLFVR